MKRKKIELVAPAGNLEKLIIAYYFGADAVYIGCNVFGLRKYADNFTLPELNIAVNIAKYFKRKIYLAFNAIAHNEDLEPTIDFLKKIKNLEFSALIVADLGILSLVKKYTDFDIHISTQANVLNTWSAKFWKSYGAKRVVLGREVNILDCANIKKMAQIEIEVFGHGSRCAGYSGQCVISNYTSARDANRGGCVQNCRHKFNLYDENKNFITSSFLMNMKDLISIDKIPDFINSGIDAIKIEGRMKSIFYIANTVNIYRKAIDAYYEKTQINLESLKKELKIVSNRTFSQGLLFEPNSEQVNDTGNSYVSGAQFIGIVKKIEKNISYLYVLNPIVNNEELIYFDWNLGKKKFKVKINEKRSKINKLVKIKGINFSKEFALIYRMRKSNE